MARLASSGVEICRNTYLSITVSNSPVPWSQLIS
jgi:hypothetical protein